MGYLFYIEVKKKEKKKQEVKKEKMKKRERKTNKKRTNAFILPDPHIFFSNINFHIY